MAEDKGNNTVVEEASAITEAVFAYQNATSAPLDDNEGKSLQVRKNTGILYIGYIYLVRNTNT